MENAVPGQVTRVLAAAADGDEQAAAELLPMVYRELRSLGEARMAKMPPGNTLQPTALVHEAYLRLVGSTDSQWQGRRHFFGAAAQAMRNIFVEQARRKGRVKHGGEHNRVDFDPSELSFDPPPDEVLGLDDAQTRMEKEDPRCAGIVLLRYFAGMSEAETASLPDISERTVQREWRFARVLAQARVGSATHRPGKLSPS